MGSEMCIRDSVVIVVVVVIIIIIVVVVVVQIFGDCARVGGNRKKT